MELFIHICFIQDSNSPVCHWLANR